MKIQIRNIARNNVNAIKALVNTTFGALPEVEQSYVKQCFETDMAEGYAVVYAEYISEWQTRDERKQELCERANPYYDADKGKYNQSAQYKGFELAQAHLKNDTLSYNFTQPVQRYELQYEVDVVDTTLMVRFAYNLALAFRTAEFSLK